MENKEKSEYDWAMELLPSQFKILASKVNTWHNLESFKKAKEALLSGIDDTLPSNAPLFYLEICQEVQSFKSMVFSSAYGTAWSNLNRDFPLLIDSFKDFNWEIKGFNIQEIYDREIKERLSIEFLKGFAITLSLKPLNPNGKFVKFQGYAANGADKTDAKLMAKSNELANKIRDLLQNNANIKIPFEVNPPYKGNFSYGNYHDKPIEEMVVNVNLPYIIPYDN